MMRPFVLSYGFLPVWFRPRDGVWHRSFGPVQCVSHAVFKAPHVFPVTVMLASVAAAQFYFAAAISIMVVAACTWLSLWVLAGLAVALFAARGSMRRNWLAARYALALDLTKGEPQILFWSGQLANQVGIDRGAARALLERWGTLIKGGQR